MIVRKKSIEENRKTENHFCLSEPEHRMSVCAYANTSIYDKQI